MQNDLAYRHIQLYYPLKLYPHAGARSLFAPSNILLFNLYIKSNWGFLLYGDFEMQENSTKVCLVAYQKCD